MLQQLRQGIGSNGCGRRTERRQFRPQVTLRAEQARPETVPAAKRSRVDGGTEPGGPARDTFDNGFGEVEQRCVLPSTLDGVHLIQVFDIGRPDARGKGGSGLGWVVG